MKLCDCVPGTRLKADGGFTCICAESVVTVEQNGDGMYVRCAEGRHYLDGQLDDTGELIGFSPAGP